MKKSSNILKSNDKTKVNRKKCILNTVTFIKIITDIIKNIYEILKNLK